MSKRIINRVILSSALAIAALAGVSNTAFAHGTDNHHRQPDRARRDHAVFHQEEAQRRAIQDRERTERSQRRRLRFERERREFLRTYGIRSPQYRGFIARWERRWNDAIERERRLMIQQREAARARHAEYHLAVDGVDYLSLDGACIDRELARTGAAGFPYGDDHRFRRIDEDYPRRGREYRDRDFDDVDVDADVGFRVRVHN